MSTTLNQEKAIAQESTKFIKLLVAVQKFLAKQLLTLLVIAIISFPVAAIIKYALEKNAPEFAEALTKSFKDTGLYMIIYTLTFFGFYFSKMVLNAIQALVKPKTPAS